MSYQRYIYTTVYVRFSFALSHEDLTVLCTGIPVFRSMPNMISTWQRFALGFVAVCWSLNILAASLNSLTSQNGNLNGFWSYLNNLKFINFTFSFLAYCFRPDVSALSTFCCHISLPIRIFLLEGIRKHFTYGIQHSNDWFHSILWWPHSSSSRLPRAVSQFVRQ